LHTTTFHAVRLALGGFFISLASLAQSAEPVAIETFFSNANISEAELSPDGDFVAIVGPGHDKHRKLAIMDLASHDLNVIAGYEDGDIADAHWINDHRLTYSTTELGAAPGDMTYTPGLFAMDRDGKKGLELARRHEVDGPYVYSALLQAGAEYLTHDPKMASENIYVLEADNLVNNEYRSTSLVLVDSAKGKAWRYERPGNIFQWLIDPEGEPRIAVGEEKGRTVIFHRGGTTDWKWKKIADFNAYDGSGFHPIAVGANDKLYVVTTRNGNASAVFRYDLATNKMEDEPLVSIKGYDFEGTLLFDAAREKLIGVRYLSDALSTNWVDDKYKALQEAIDKQLPGLVNILQLPRKAQSENVLVDSYSDVQPHFFWIYNKTSGKLTPIGGSHPDVDSKKMAYQDMVHYAARDGLDIPAYLTLPKEGGKKNLPLILFVHGGPWVRDTWGWDPEVQFLASRGYAVLQPQYRGSVGFGFKHFQAGWRQWGLAMQDDLADGVKWAVAQGIADPKRVCIMGSSYGGYATLMGLAKNPDLYRCGVEWVGVTDIDLMFQRLWNSDASEEYQRFGMPILIGDRDKDAAMLKANSPVNLASKITQPLIMGAGGMDARVPIDHGKAFRDAIKPYNSKAQWLYYWNEAHGWRLEKTRADFWGKVETFLDANLKQAK